MKIWSLVLFLNTHSQEPFISKLAQRKSLKAEENVIHCVSLNVPVYKFKHPMDFLTHRMLINYHVQLLQIRC